VHLFNLHRGVPLWLWGVAVLQPAQLRRGARFGSHMYGKNDCISSTISRVPFTLAASRVFPFSEQLLCLSVAGELLRCCGSVRVELCAI
jgi:hypothetical protein